MADVAPLRELQAKHPRRFPALGLVGNTPLVRLEFFSAWSVIAVAAVALSLTLGCKQSGPPSTSKAKAASAKSAGGKVYTPIKGAEKLIGRVRMGPVQWPFGHRVGHTPQMDLRLQCVAAVEDAKEKGGAVPPLCYDKKQRKGITSIRVETDVKGKGSTIVGYLRSRGEAAHFMVEPTGSVYQLLNMSHAPRRAGGIQGGEVRVLSANPATTKKLVAALIVLFGNVAVVEETVTFSTPPKPGAPTP